jgi:hypothetical protein
MVDVYDTELTSVIDANEFTEEQLDKSIVDMIAAIKNSELNIELLASEKKKMDKKIKSIKLNLVKYEFYLKQMLLIKKDNKFKNALHRATLCEEQLKLVVHDKSKLPEKYFQQITEFVLDKQKLNEDFKDSGEILDGCTVETYRKLIIK